MRFYVGGPLEEWERLLLESDDALAETVRAASTLPASSTEDRDEPRQASK